MALGERVRRVSRRLPVSDPRTGSLPAGPGPDADADYIYIADVGNNLFVRDVVYIYRAGMVVGLSPKR